MKILVFLFIISLPIKVLSKQPVCPILKTVIKSVSKDNKKILTLCDLDDHYIFSFGNKNNPEIILYKKSHEVFLTMPRKGTELNILDGIKRYQIVDNEERAYLVEIDDEKNIIIFMELDKNNGSYINRSYILLNRK